MATRAASWDQDVAPEASPSTPSSRASLCIQPTGGFFFWGGGGRREADNFLMGSVAPIQPVRLAASPGHTNPVPTNPPRLGLVGKEPEGQRQTASKVPRWHLPALCPPL